MSKPVNHHFVPRHFLRPWAEDETTQVHVFEAEKSFQNSLSNICSRDYFHGNPEVEKELAKIESEYERVLEKLRCEPNIGGLDNSDISLLLSFFAFQRNRTKAIKDEIWETGEEILGDGIREDFEEASLVLDDEESYIDNLTDAYVQSVHYYLMIHGILGHIILGDLDVALLCNQTDIPFVTCDVPIAHDNPRFKPPNQPIGPGVANPGIQLFCPINPSLTVFLFDPECYQVKTNQRGQLILNRPKVIRELNDLQVYDARNIIIHSGAPEAEIERLHQNWEKSDRLEEVSQTHNSEGYGDLELEFEPTHQIPTFSPDIPHVSPLPAPGNRGKQLRDPIRYKKQKGIIHKVMTDANASDVAVIYAVRLQLERISNSN